MIKKFLALFLAIAMFMEPVVPVYSAELLPYDWDYPAEAPTGGPEPDSSSAPVPVTAVLAEPNPLTPASELTANIEQYSPKDLWTKLSFNQAPPEGSTYVLIDTHDGRRITGEPTNLLDPAGSSVALEDAAPQMYIFRGLDYHGMGDEFYNIAIQNPDESLTSLTKSYAHPFHPSGDSFNMEDWKQNWSGDFLIDGPLEVSVVTPTPAEPSTESSGPQTVVPEGETAQQTAALKTLFAKTRELSENAIDEWSLAGACSKDFSDFQHCTMNYKISSIGETGQVSFRETLQLINQTDGMLNEQKVWLLENDQSLLGPSPEPNPPGSVIAKIQGMLVDAAFLSFANSSTPKIESIDDPANQHMTVTGPYLIGEFNYVSRRNITTGNMERIITNGMLEITGGEEDDFFAARNFLNNEPSLMPLVQMGALIEFIPSNIPEPEPSPTLTPTPPAQVTVQADDLSGNLTLNTATDSSRTPKKVVLRRNASDGGLELLFYMQNENQDVDQDPSYKFLIPDSSSGTINLNEGQFGTVTRTGLGPGMFVFNPLQGTTFSFGQTGWELSNFMINENAAGEPTSLTFGDSMGNSLLIVNSPTEPGADQQFTSTPADTPIPSNSPSSTPGLNANIFSENNPYTTTTGADIILLRPQSITETEPDTRSDFLLLRPDNNNNSWRYLVLNGADPNTVNTADATEIEGPAAVIVLPRARTARFWTTPDGLSANVILERIPTPIPSPTSPPPALIGEIIVDGTNEANHQAFALPDTASLKIRTEWDVNSGLVELRTYNATISKNNDGTRTISFYALYITELTYFAFTIPAGSGHVDLKTVQFDRRLTNHSPVTLVLNGVDLDALEFTNDSNGGLYDLKFLNEDASQLRVKFQGMPDMPVEELTLAGRNIYPNNMLMQTVGFTDTTFKIDVGNASYAPPSSARFINNSDGSKSVLFTLGLAQAPQTQGLISQALPWVNYLALSFPPLPANTLVHEFDLAAAQFASYTAPVGSSEIPAGVTQTSAAITFENAGVNRVRARYDLDGNFISLSFKRHDEPLLTTNFLPVAITLAGQYTPSVRVPYGADDVQQTFGLPSKLTFIARESSGPIDHFPMTLQYAEGLDDQGNGTRWLRFVLENGAIYKLKLPSPAGDSNSQDLYLSTALFGRINGGLFQTVPFERLWPQFLFRGGTSLQKVTLTSNASKEPLALVFKDADGNALLTLNFESRPQISIPIDRRDPDLIDILPEDFNFNVWDIDIPHTRMEVLASFRNLLGALILRKGNMSDPMWEHFVAVNANLNAMDPPEDSASDEGRLANRIATLKDMITHVSRANFNQSIQVDPETEFADPTSTPSNNPVTYPPDDLRYFKSKMSDLRRDVATYNRTIQGLLTEMNNRWISRVQELPPPGPGAQAWPDIQERYNDRIATLENQRNSAISLFFTIYGDAITTAITNSTTEPNRILNTYQDDARYAYRSTLWPQVYGILAAFRTANPPSSADISNLRDQILRVYEIYKDSGISTISKEDMTLMLDFLQTAGALIEDTGMPSSQIQNFRMTNPETGSPMYGTLTLTDGWRRVGNKHWTLAGKPATYRSNLGYNAYTWMADAKGVEERKGTVSNLGFYLETIFHNPASEVASKLEFIKRVAVGPPEPVTVEVRYRPNPPTFPRGRIVKVPNKYVTEIWEPAVAPSTELMLKTRILNPAILLSATTPAEIEQAAQTLADNILSIPHFRAAFVAATGQSPITRIYNVKTQTWGPAFPDSILSKQLVAYLIDLAKEASGWDRFMKDLCHLELNENGKITVKYPVSAADSPKDAQNQPIRMNAQGQPVRLFVTSLSLGRTTGFDENTGRFDSQGRANNGLINSIIGVRAFGASAGRENCCDIGSYIGPDGTSWWTPFALILEGGATIDTATGNAVMIPVRDPQTSLPKVDSAGNPVLMPAVDSYRKAEYLYFPDGDASTPPHQTVKLRWTSNNTFVPADNVGNSAYVEKMRSLGYMYYTPAASGGDGLYSLVDDRTTQRRPEIISGTSIYGIAAHYVGNLYNPLSLPWTIASAFTNRPGSGLTWHTIGDMLSGIGLGAKKIAEAIVTVGHTAIFVNSNSVESAGADSENRDNYAVNAQAGYLQLTGATLLDATTGRVSQAVLDALSVLTERQKSILRYHAARTKRAALAQELGVGENELTQLELGKPAANGMSLATIRQRLRPPFSGSPADILEMGQMLLPGSPLGAFGNVVYLSQNASLSNYSNEAIGWTALATAQAFLDQTAANLPMLLALHAFGLFSNALMAARASVGAQSILTTNLSANVAVGTVLSESIIVTNNLLMMYMTANMGLELPERLITAVDLIKNGGDPELIANTIAGLLTDASFMGVMMHGFMHRGRAPSQTLMQLDQMIDSFVSPLANRMVGNMRALAPAEFAMRNRTPEQIVEMLRVLRPVDFTPEQALRLRTLLESLADPNLSAAQRRYVQQRFEETLRGQSADPTSQNWGLVEGVDMITVTAPTGNPVRSVVFGKNTFATRAENGELIVRLESGETVRVRQGQSGELPLSEYETMRVTVEGQNIRFQRVASRAPQQSTTTAVQAAGTNPTSTPQNTAGRRGSAELAAVASLGITGVLMSGAVFLLAGTAGSLTLPPGILLLAIGGAGVTAAGLIGINLYQQLRPGTETAARESSISYGDGRYQVADGGHVILNRNRPNSRTGPRIEPLTEITGENMEGRYEVIRTTADSYTVHEILPDGSINTTLVDAASGRIHLPGRNGSEGIMLEVRDGALRARNESGAPIDIRYDITLPSIEVLPLAINPQTGAPIEGTGTIAPGQRVVLPKLTETGRDNGYRLTTADGKEFILYLDSDGRIRMAPGNRAAGTTEAQMRDALRQCCTDGTRQINLANHDIFIQNVSGELITVSNVRPGRITSQPTLEALPVEMGRPLRIEIGRGTTSAEVVHVEMISDGTNGSVKTYRIRHSDGRTWEINETNFKTDGLKINGLLDLHLLPNGKVLVENLSTREGRINRIDTSRETDPALIDQWTANRAPQQSVENNEFDFSRPSMEQRQPVDTFSEAASAAEGRLFSELLQNRTSRRPLPDRISEFLMKSENQSLLDELAGQHVDLTSRDGFPLLDSVVNRIVDAIRNRMREGRSDPTEDLVGLHEVLEQVRQESRANPITPLPAEEPGQQVEEPAVTPRADPQVTLPSRPSSSNRNHRHRLRLGQEVETPTVDNNVEIPGGRTAVMINLDNVGNFETFTIPDSTTGRSQTVTITRRMVGGEGEYGISIGGRRVRLPREARIWTDIKNSDGSNSGLQIQIVLDHNGIPLLAIRNTGANPVTIVRTTGGPRSWQVSDPYTWLDNNNPVPLNRTPTTAPAETPARQVEEGTVPVAQNQNSQAEPGHVMQLGNGPIEVGNTRTSSIPGTEGWTVEARRSVNSTTEFDTDTMHITVRDGAGRVISENFVELYAEISTVNINARGHVSRGAENRTASDIMQLDIYNDGTVIMDTPARPVTTLPQLVEPPVRDTVANSDPATQTPRTNAPRNSSLPMQSEPMVPPRPVTVPELINGVTSTQTLDFPAEGLVIRAAGVNNAFTLGRNEQGQVTLQRANGVEISPHRTDPNSFGVRMSDGTSLRITVDGGRATITRRLSVINTTGPTINLAPINQQNLFSEGTAIIMPGQASRINTQTTANAQPSPLIVERNAQGQWSMRRNYGDPEVITGDSWTYPNGGQEYVFRINGNELTVRRQFRNANPSVANNTLAQPPATSIGNYPLPGRTGQSVEITRVVTDDFHVIYRVEVKVNGQPHGNPYDIALGDSIYVIGGQGNNTRFGTAPNSSGEWLMRVDLSLEGEVSRALPPTVPAQPALMPASSLGTPSNDFAMLGTPGISNISGIPLSSQSFTGLIDSNTPSPSQQPVSVASQIPAGPAQSARSVSYASFTAPSFSTQAVSGTQPISPAFVSNTLQNSVSQDSGSSGNNQANLSALMSNYRNSLAANSPASASTSTFTSLTSPTASEETLSGLASLLGLDPLNTDPLVLQDILDSGTANNLAWLDYVSGHGKDVLAALAALQSQTPNLPAALPEGDNADSRLENPPSYVASLTTDPSSTGLPSWAQDIPGVQALVQQNNGDSGAPVNSFDLNSSATA